MKTQKIDVARVWKDLVDSLAPALNFSSHDRAVYSFLFRHSHLEGKRKLQFSLAAMGHSLGISRTTVRNALRHLITQGVVQLLTRGTHASHIVSVNLPSEVRAIQASKSAAARRAFAKGPVLDIERADFLRRQILRRSIHERDGGRCFYCLRTHSHQTRCLDHVVPRARLGGNSYRNIVSCCHDCNSKKNDGPAEEFLRWLFRERKLNSAELRGRFHALRSLKAGKLKPPLPSQ